jgi:hypothetical protein
MDLKILALVLLTGCGGAVFSAETVPTDDANGDVITKTDAGTDVAADADAGQPDAGQPEAAPSGMPEAGPVPEAGTAETGSTPEAGTPEAAPPPPPPTCLSTLNDIGTGDFRISFTMVSTGAQVVVPLVNQRAGCNQTSVLWQAVVDGYLGGKALFNMCDVTGSGSCSTVGPSVSTSSPVDDGLPHQIVISQVSGVVSISSDGVVGTTSPDTYSFETFGAPVTIGTDDCGDPPLTGYGTLKDLCISRP